MPQSPRARPVFDTASRTDNLRASFEMLGGVMGFAAMAAIAHGTGEYLAWPLVAFGRIVVTAVLAAFMLHASGLAFVFQGGRALWVRSLAGTTALSLNFFALTHLPITDAVVIFSTNVLWINALLALFFRRRVPPATWAYAALALAGVYVLHNPEFDARLLPLLLALGGAFFMAVAKLALAHCKPLGTLPVVVHYSTTASLATLAMCALQWDALVRAEAPLPGWLWLGLAGMGLAGTVGQVMMTTAYRRGHPTFVALVGISQIVFAAALDLLIWGNGFTERKLLGVAMITTAVVLSIVTSARAPAPTRDAEAQPEAS